MKPDLYDRLPQLDRAARRARTIRAGFDKIAAAEGRARREATLDLIASRPEVDALGALIGLEPDDRRQALEGLPLKASAVKTLLDLLGSVDERPAVRSALGAALPYSLPRPAADEWALYKAKLAELGREPVLGDAGAVALADIYVPARYELRECDHQARHRLLEPARKEPDETGVDAIARVLRLLEEGPEPVFVVGLPGIGKSSFARILTSRLAQSDRWHPVFLPLRRIDSDRALDEQIREHLRSPGGEARLAELAQRFEQAPDVVLVLDGFDELAGVGRQGHQGFFLRAKDLARDLGLRLVLTGRDTLLAGETAFPRGSSIMRLLDFDEEQVRAWCTRWKAATGTTFDATAHLSSEASGIDPLVRQPLLLYLLAHLEREGLELPAASDATLYQKIVSELCARHVAERPGNGLTAGRLRRLLGIAGWVAMARGAEQVRRDDLERAITSSLPGVDAEQVVGLAEGTLLAFYFRRVSPDEWEFTHKSFGEYLAAEHLAGVIHSLTVVSTDPFGEERRTLGESAAAEALIEAFGPAMIPMSVERWLPDMLADWPGFLAGRSESREGLLAAQERLLELIPRLLDEIDAETALRVAREWGVPPRFISARDAFNLAAVAGLAATLQRKRLDLRTLCDDRWVSFHDLVSVAATPWHFDRVTGRAVITNPSAEELQKLGHTSCRGLRIEGEWEPSGAHLRGLDLRGAVFAGTSGRRCIGGSWCGELDASEADLSGSSFLSNWFHSANFGDADLREVWFRNCELREANFDRAILTGAQFDSCVKLTKLDGKLNADGRVLPAYLDDEGRFHPDGAPGKKVPSKKKRKPNK